MKERIEKNEKYLDEITEFVKELDKVNNSITNIKPKLKRLNEYYGSKEWFKDLEEYDKEKPDYKAGVLSEDGVWNTTEELFELLTELQEKIKTFMKTKN